MTRALLQKNRASSAAPEDVASSDPVGSLPFHNSQIVQEISALVHALRPTFVAISVFL
jgi:hypothetical protein